VETVEIVEIARKIVSALYKFVVEIVEFVEMEGKLFVLDLHCLHRSPHKISTAGKIFKKCTRIKMIFEC
jgi:hypothetical protein